MDKRIKKLASNLVNKCCKLKKGEKLLIFNMGEESKPLVKAIIKEAYKIGALPFVDIMDNSIHREFLLNVTEEQMEIFTKTYIEKLSCMDAYININATNNSTELLDVDPENLSLYAKYYKKISEVRAKKKWVVIKYPTSTMAQIAKTSLESFEDYYFEIANFDYEKLHSAMDKLVELMNKTDKVQIKGNETDLTFSIKGINTIKCSCEVIPDGEVYTSPVKDSVNGYITYNVPYTFKDFTFENIRLEFKDGKIINATANNSKKLNELLDAYEGARYIGEFGIGLNPSITKPINNVLFDEKISGSIHFTPGNAYKNAYNGNTSEVHLDFVLIQTKDYGGGEIYFDDVLVRKDGIFVLDELKCLNPENLI